MDLSIKPIETSKKDIKQTKAMEQGFIPAFNEGSVVIVGAVKSGKSVLMANLANDRRFYKNFFKKENKYLFSPTASFDPIADKMGIPRDNRFDDGMESQLQDLMDEQLEAIEDKGANKAPKLLLVFDDLSSMKKLQRSKVFERIFTTNRHLNIMVIVAVHKISALTRLCRLQCAHIIFFGATRSEMELLAEEFCGNGLNKKQMIELIEYATTPEENNKYPFLYINLTRQMNERYRKNFNIILELNNLKSEEENKHKPNERRRRRGEDIMSKMS